MSGKKGMTWPENSPGRKRSDKIKFSGVLPQREHDILSKKAREKGVSLSRLIMDILCKSLK